MIRSLPCALLSLVALAAPSLAQQGGVWSVQGQDPTHGPYAGQVELRPAPGGGYQFVRVIELGAARHAGRRISVVWTGAARDVSGGIAVDLALERMGWAGDGAGITRSPSDGVPVAVTATFTANGAGGLVGSWSGGGLALPQGETWTRQGPSGPTPIWRSERARVPMHRAPGALTRQLLFGLFRSYHQTAWVAPWVPRPELQAAVHFVTRDPTDFALHRAQPDLLRVVQRVVDPLTLAEAALKADAYGQTLLRKAELADAEATTFLDANVGTLTWTVNGQPEPSGDGDLWTGVYVLSQALRWQATRDPVALQNVERTARSCLVAMQIDGDPAEFARTVLSAGPTPRGGNWHPGTGPFQGLEWLQGGNDDMFKGLITTGLAMQEALPAGHPLRAQYAAELSQLARLSSVANKRTSSNGLLAHGLAHLLGGARADRDAYRRKARNPFFQLAGLFDGGFLWQGISDWSGNHLGVCGTFTRTRVAELMNERVEGFTSRLALRMAEARLRPSRPTLHTIAAAGRARLSWLSRIDTSDAVWGLREIPIPRSVLRAAHGLRPEFCLSPWPSLPWKFDWTTNQGRTQGHEVPPRFEHSPDIYRWKQNPLVDQSHGDGPAVRYASVDYLFAYWLARVEGVVGPND